MTKKECLKKVRERLKKARNGLSADYSYYQGMVTGIEKALEIFGMMQEPSLPSGVDKAAVKAFKELVDSDKNNFLEIFKAGAKWAIEQITNEKSI